jgi:hypothetical protein
VVDKILVSGQVITVLCKNQTKNRYQKKKTKFNKFIEMKCMQATSLVLSIMWQLHSLHATGSQLKLFTTM